MNCLRCGSPINLGQPTCAQCGTPLDADGNGVPDVLERLIEDKARAIVDAQREREASERAQAASYAAEQREHARDESNRRDLADARGELEKAEAEKPPIYRFSTLTTMAALALALTVGLPATCVGEMIVGRPAWGNTLCPYMCRDCRGPARIFSWRTITNGNMSNHTRALCSTSRLEADSIRPGDAIDPGQFQDVELTDWLRIPLTILVLTLIGALLLPFASARFAERSLASRRRALENRIEHLERAIGPDPPTSNAPFR
jgi:hypothetical protein